jgi:hypothetical protein
MMQMLSLFDNHPHQDIVLIKASNSNISQSVGLTRTVYVHQNCVFGEFPCLLLQYVHGTNGSGQPYLSVTKTR